ncbi:hypothetical protein AbraIFM66951_010999 [Aspergillus brasiliensis]|uniref:Oxidoreductase-like domain-containing protein n=1 Tax=Aspergillus brasiliensis TaxID=319629 RepID=A0A9W5YMI6_9EURO|nr:hypothetical protein AbraCBS73388_003860 [Aspergillus brasiliensis]GKZ41718.1 hypothetical protein AbraIFM66951_010999 [Aspergillus brasiliensis]
MSPSPLYTPENVPSIKKRRNRLPNTRAKQLLRAADRDFNDPPPPPGLGECCGSSCDPCVNDLWKEELAVWRERWGDGAVEDGDKKGDEQGDESEGCVKMKMPGSWECSTAEDLPDASFTGQQKSYLNIVREYNGFDHLRIAFSVCVQRMTRSDTSGSGVTLFTDTETDLDRVVSINASWGLGEDNVQGTVNPDEHQVFEPLVSDGYVRGDKFIKMIYGNCQTPTRNVSTSKTERAVLVLTDRKIFQLTRRACTVETHYGCSRDMKWTSLTNGLSTVPARPGIVHSRRDATAAFKTYRLGHKGRTLTTGLAVYV